ncbi:MAG: peptide deformylase [Patescibacteria group bacterium]|jgi:peptide deformylase|nr:peptide deformylase [Patescibacteria group bacterium]
MILPIYTEPNPILHQVAEPVAVFDEELQQLISDMRETMRNARGVGLAAPQVGKSISLCIIEQPDEDPEYDIPLIVLINPRITWKSTRKVKMEEGCLSMPGLEGPVMRPDRIRVKAKDETGEPIEIEAEGYLARVIQHEIDHLNGILFTSYVEKKRLKQHPPLDYPRL